MVGMSDEHDQHSATGPQGPQQPQQPQPQQPQPQMEPQQAQHPQQPPQSQQPQQPQQPQQQPFNGQGGDQRQWVQVPPPHPYATSSSTSGPGAGKALAITAMALGLVALLTVLVSVFYFSPIIAYSAATIGAAAVIVAVIALVRRSRPVGAGVTGVVTGALSLIVVSVLAMLGALAQTAPLVEAAAPGAEGEQWSPDSPQESLVDWPANMATGGIIFSGPGDPRPMPSDPLTPGTAPQANAVDRDAANDLLIYVDYSCPHCAAFEQGNGEFMTQVLTDDVATIEIVPLSFMDRASTNEYSSRAAGAVACLVDAQPEAAWAGHSALLNPDLQPNGAAGLTNDEIIAVFEQAVGEVNPEAADCIRTERFTVFAKALNEWVFQNAVPNANVEGARIEGTPSVFVNGEFFPGSPDDTADFQAFFEEHTN